MTSTNGKPYIDVQNLTFRYPDGTLALENINLKLGDGDFVALIGQNGSGKTTLSKCLNGLYKPTEGDVIVDGLNSRTTSITKMAVRVGYVFQNPDHQLFNNNIWDEIAYGPKNIQLPEDEIKDRVEEAARVVGLKESHFEDHPFFLTKGLRQRVAIASILALRPRVIIVDEPTTGQDIKQSLEIMDFLMQLHTELGHIIVIITHDMNIVARYAKRTVLMAHREILEDGPTSEVFSRHDSLIEANVEPTQVTQLAQRCQSYGFDPGTLSVKSLMNQLKNIKK